MQIGGLAKLSLSKSSCRSSLPKLTTVHLNRNFVAATYYKAEPPHVMSISYLGQQSSQDLDKDLMSPGYGFAIEQLMELAGLSCAQGLAKVYAKEKYPKVLVCCGPGNQGGDGLVAARHLWHWGYKPTLFYPKQTENPLYKSLTTQCLRLSISMIPSDPSLSTSDVESEFEKAFSDTDVVLDAIFGFSFHGEPRPPFAHTITQLTSNPHRKPIVSVDIPSAWDVEKGNIGNTFAPAVLVSLTCPKLGSTAFKGRHFLGGRFIPPGIVEKYGLKLPEYAGQDQVVDITDFGVCEKL